MQTVSRHLIQQEEIPATPHSGVTRWAAAKDLPYRLNGKGKRTCSSAFLSVWNW
jgi:hypothetical protein